jgi:hypothetical protein
MITYETIKSLPDVAKRANELGLKINEFQVAHYANRCGGAYAFFYDDGKEPKKKKTAPAETAEKPKTPKRKTLSYNEVKTQLDALHQVTPAECEAIMESNKRFCCNGITAPHPIPQDKDGYCPAGFDKDPPPGKDCLGKDLPF